MPGTLPYARLFQTLHGMTLEIAWFNRNRLLLSQPGNVPGLYRCFPSRSRASVASLGALDVLTPSVVSHPKKKKQNHQHVLVLNTRWHLY